MFSVSSQTKYCWSYSSLWVDTGQKRDSGRSKEMHGDYTGAIPSTKVTINNPFYGQTHWQSHTLKRNTTVGGRHFHLLKIYQAALHQLLAFCLSFKSHDPSYIVKYLSSDMNVVKMVPTSKQGWVNVDLRHALISSMEYPLCFSNSKMDSKVIVDTGASFGLVHREPISQRMLQAIWK